MHLEGDNRYYRHCDGGLYRTGGITFMNADTGEEWILYHHMWPFERKLCGRSLEEWQDGRFQEITIFEFLDLQKGDRAAAQTAIAEAKAARRAARDAT